jgi:hypothetical protein
MPYDGYGYPPPDPNFYQYNGYRPMIPQGYRPMQMPPQGPYNQYYPGGFVPAGYGPPMNMNEYPGTINLI